MDDTTNMDQTLAMFQDIYIEEDVPAARLPPAKALALQWISIYARRQILVPLPNVTGMSFPQLFQAIDAALGVTARNHRIRAMMVQGWVPYPSTFPLKESHWDDFQAFLSRDPRPLLVRVSTVRLPHVRTGVDGLVGAMEIMDIDDDPDK